MAQYKITAPDGNNYLISGPDDAPQEELIDALNHHLEGEAQRQREHEAKTGFFPALKAGAREFIGSTEKALGFEEAAAKQFEKAAQTYEPTTAEDIANTQGIFPTAGKYLSKYVTEPLGGIGGRFGAPIAAGFAAPLVAPEAAIGALGATAIGAGATALADLPAEYGENIRAREEAGLAPDPTLSGAAALFQAALAGFGPGTKGISKVIGPKVFEEAKAILPEVRAGLVSKEEAIATLSSKAKIYAQEMGVNTVAGTAMMVGTEEARRLQAEQPLMTAGEIGETALQAGILSPFFAALHPSSRAEAEALITKKADQRERVVQKTLDRINAERDRQAGIAGEAKREALVRDMQEKAEKVRLEQERQKEMEERLSYLRPEERQPATTKENVAAAVKAEDERLSAPSGQFGIDPVTQKEREFTVGEVEKMQSGPVKPEPREIPSLDKTTLTSFGFKENSNVYKDLQALDLSKGRQLEHFYSVLDKLTPKMTLEQRNAVDAFKQTVPEIKLDVESAIRHVITADQKYTNPAQIKTSLEDQFGPTNVKNLLAENKTILRSLLDAHKETRTAEPATGGAGVSPLGREGSRITTGTTRLEPGAMGNAGRNVRGSAKREGSEPGSLITQAKDLVKESRDIAKETRALDPNHPMIELLEDPFVTREILDGAKKELERLKALERPYVPPLDERTILKEPVSSSGIQDATKDAKTLGDALAKTHNALNMEDSIFFAGYSPIQKEFYQMLGKKLMDVPNAVNAQYHNIPHKVRSQRRRSGSPGGTYFGDQHKIAMYPGARVETLYHEAVHAATIESLDKNIVDSRNPRTMTAKTEVGQKLIDIFNAAKKGYPKSAWQYPFYNIREFVAVAHSNYDFVKYLNEKKSVLKPEQKGRKLWNDFVDVVKEMLGVPKKYDSLFDDLMSLSSDLFTGKTEKPLDFEMTRAQYRAAKSQGARNRNEASDMIFEKKKQEEPNPRFKQMYERAGGKGFQEPPKESTLFKSYTDDPVKFKTEQKTAVNKFLNKLETMWFSSDAALNNALRKGIEQTGASWDKVKELMYKASTSQALHREAIAHKVLELGGLRYDPATYKFEAFLKPGSWKGVMNEIQSAAKLNDISFNEMEKYAHQIFVALRLREVQDYNKTVLARAQALMNKGMSPAKIDTLLKNQLKEVHLSDEQINAALELSKTLKGVDKIVGEWNQTRENILDFAVERGLYTRSEAKELLDAVHYVPFFRVEQLENRAGPKEYNRGLLDIARDKKFRGSEQEVNNVFDNMERWITYIVRKGLGNQSAKDLNDAALKYLPNEVRKLNPNEKVPHNMESNVVGIWQNGSVDRYLYNDPMFVHAFTGMEPIVIPALSAASKFTDMLRQNIVLNPLFSVGQLSQDAFGAMFISGVKHPFAIPVEVVKEFVKTLRGTSTAHKELSKYGAVGIRDYSASVSRLDAEIAAGLKDPKLSDKIVKPLREFSMASDNAVRQAIYNRTLKETGDKALAIERAFEVINFRRGGASSSVNWLRQTVPFFGAYLQSLNVAAKVIAGKSIAPMQKAEARKILASNMAKVMVASFIYNALISEDEDYKKLDPTIRDRHLLIPGSGGLGLPLRSDVFTLFSKIIPEHIYQMTMAEATEDGTKAKKALTNALSNAILGPNVLPQVAKPVIEVVTNHNFFTGRPIVGQYEQTLDADKQYSVNTSQLSKMLGSVSNTSPMKWDHLLKAYFGYTGGLALMATDHVMSAGSNKPLPDKSFQDTVASIPGMSAFVAKEFGTREKSDFYELRDEVSKAVNSFNYLKTFGTAEERKDYRAEHSKLMAVKSRVNTINNALSDIRKQERLITEAPETRISPAEKQARIRALRLREQRLLSNIGNLRKQAGL